MSFLLLLASILGGMYPTGIDSTSNSKIYFVTYDSDSKYTHVSPTHVMIDENDVGFEYDVSSGKVSLIVPSSRVFSLRVKATDYNDFVSDYSKRTLNTSSINLVKIQAGDTSSGVVTWNHDSVKDLDSHMYIYDSNDRLLSEVYYSRTSYSDEHTKVTTTKDDTGGGSGETTKIDPFYKPYKYKFWLYRYSGSGSMTKSDAMCVVTINNKSETIHIPQSDTEHRWWHIYDVIDGQLKVVNELSDSHN